MRRGRYSKVGKRKKRNQSNESSGDKNKEGEERKRREKGKQVKRQVIKRLKNKAALWEAGRGKPGISEEGKGRK